jgi:hypothetical protein
MHKDIGMHILTAQNAISQINNVFSEMDLDDLARTVTMITNLQNVIVIDDDVIIPDEIKNPLRGLVEDGTIGVSDVFTDGLPVGYVDERGEIIEFGEQFTTRKPLDEQDIGTMNAHLDNKDLIPIYDDESGKLVCYATAKYVNKIVAGLERA